MRPGGLIYYYKGAHGHAISDFTRGNRDPPHSDCPMTVREREFESEEARLRSEEYIGHFSARIAAAHYNRGNAYRVAEELDRAIEDYGA